MLKRGTASVLLAGLVTLAAAAPAPALGLPATATDYTTAYNGTTDVRTPPVQAPAPAAPAPARAPAPAQQAKPAGGGGGGGAPAPAPVHVPTRAEQLASWTAQRDGACAAGDFEGCYVAATMVGSLRDGGGPGAAPVYTPAQERQIAAHLRAKITMPEPIVQIAPGPTQNEFGMAVVGVPLWFSTSESAYETDTASGFGVTVTIVAHRRSTTFDLGDSTTLTCTSMTPWTPDVAPGTPSPDCGHTYQVPSLPKGPYPIRVVATWDIEWTINAQRGTDVRTTDVAVSLPVGELQSLNGR